MNKNLSRRKFLKVLTTATAAMPVCYAANLLTPQVTYATPPNVPVDSISAKGKQFGYHEDATTVDTTKYPKRAGEEGKTQFCSNCQLLTSSDVKVEGKDGTYGACSLFPEGVVATNGWCNMWVQKVS